MLKTVQEGSCIFQHLGEQKLKLSGIVALRGIGFPLDMNHIFGQEVSEMLAEAMRLSAHVRRGSSHRLNPNSCYVLSTVSQRAASTRWRRLLVTSQ